MASAISVVHHSSSWTTLASPWSAVASPVGRYGVLREHARQLVPGLLERIPVSGARRSPLTEASRRAASSRADPAAAARSRSPGDGVESRSTAAVAATEASHQPASRSGIMLTVPGVATGSR